LTALHKPLLSLHIGIEYGTGGEGRVVTELMRSLPAAGFDFQGLVGAPADVAITTQGQVKSFAPDRANLLTRMVGARRAIGEALQQRKPAIVASHFALYTAPALDLLRYSRNVSHFHGPWSAESFEEGQRGMALLAKMQIECAVYRRADRVIVLSKAFGDLAEETFRVDRNRIRIVPGCVDVDRFAVSETREECRELLGLPNSRPLLVSVRRLARRMGLQNLIEAMRTVVRKEPETLLCIGGRGPMQAELLALTERYGLSQNVNFLGFVKEEHLPLLYRAADINLVPTEALEGFGLVAAEGLAAGTPSMVTPVGGLPEVVSGLSSNLIFPSALPVDIAEALCQAISRRLPLPTAEACSAYARAHFTTKRMAEQTASVYRELLDL
jgi:glycogen synthase